MTLRDTLFGPVWKWPLILGVATACGLLSALIGDGVWDGLSWLALGAPVAVGVLLSLRRAG
jgi:hypothetical protein